MNGSVFKSAWVFSMKASKPFFACALAFFSSSRACNAFSLCECDVCKCDVYVGMCASVMCASRCVCGYVCECDV